MCTRRTIDAGKELEDGVLEASGLERNYRRAGGKVLLLHDAAGLEQRRHETKVAAQTQQNAVGEELVGIRL